MKRTLIVAFQTTNQSLQHHLRPPLSKFFFCAKFSLYVHRTSYRAQKDLANLCHMTKPYIRGRKTSSRNHKECEQVTK